MTYAVDSIVVTRRCDVVSRIFDVVSLRFYVGLRNMPPVFLTSVSGYVKSQMSIGGSILAQFVQFLKQCSEIFLILF